MHAITNNIFLTLICCMISFMLSLPMDACFMGKEPAERLMCESVDVMVQLPLERSNREFEYIQRPFFKEIIRGMNCFCVDPPHISTITGKIADKINLPFYQLNYRAFVKLYSNLTNAKRR